MTGAAAREEVPGDTEARDLGLVVFALGEARYAFDVASVVEVVAPLVATPLFDLPDHVLGVMNLRGRVLPVSHLATLLARPREGGEERVGVRVRFGGEEAIFAVDRVFTVRWIDSARLEESSPASGSRTAGYFRGVLPDDPPVTCLAIPRLFDPEVWGGERSEAAA